MKKRFMFAVSIATIGVGLLMRQTTTTKQSKSIVLISGNDPAFDAAMHNVFLLKRVDPDKPVSTIKAIHDFTNAPLEQVKILVQHGGYICGLSDDDKELLKVQLETLGCLVELK